MRRAAVIYGWAAYLTIAGALLGGCATNYDQALVDACKGTTTEINRLAVIRPQLTAAQVATVEAQRPETAPCSGGAAAATKANVERVTAAKAKLASVKVGG